MKYIKNKHMPLNIKNGSGVNSPAWWVEQINTDVINITNRCNLAPGSLDCDDCLFNKFVELIEGQEIPNGYCLQKRKKYFKEFFNYVSDKALKGE